jgi:hypothetical protein
MGFLSSPEIEQLSCVSRELKTLIGKEVWSSSLVICRRSVTQWLRKAILNQKLESLYIHLSSIPKSKIYGKRPGFFRPGRNPEGHYSSVFFTELVKSNQESLKILVVFGDWNNRLSDTDLLSISMLNLERLSLITFENTGRQDFSHISKIASLKYLDLSFSRITDEILSNLPTLKLSSLKLNGCRQVTDAGLQYLSGMPLQYLNLTDCSQITDSGLQFLSRMPLQHLKLNECFSITDAGLQALSDMPLQHLDLVHCHRVTDAGLQALSGMPLQHLDLLYCREITDKGLHALKELKLQHLDISYCNKITDAGLQALSGMPLQHLNLGYCRKITDTGLQYLSGMPLQYLNLADCSQISDAGLWHLSGMRLQHLNLYDCNQITDAGLQALSGIPLQHLNISGCNKITDAGLQALSGMPLQHLNISCTNVKGDVEVKLYYLRTCDVSNTGVITLPFLYESKRIESVNLSKCLLLVDLNHLSGKKFLRKLNLSDCECIRNTQMISLLGTSLVDLNLENSKVNDRGVRVLRNIPSLRDLTLSGTRVSEKGLEYFYNLHLSKLAVNRCKSLKSLPSLPKTLVEFNVVKCKNLETEHFEALLGLPSLETLGVEATYERRGLYYILSGKGLITQSDFDLEEMCPSEDDGSDAKSSDSEDSDT